MPTLTLNLFDRFRRKQFEAGQLDFETPGGNGFKLAIVDTDYVPNQNTGEFWDTGGNDAADPSFQEVSGTGYTTLGNLCDNGIVTVDGAGLVKIDLDDPAAWAENAAGFANGRRFILLLDNGGAATTLQLVGYSNEAAADFGNTTGPVTAAFATGGAFDSPR